MQRTILGHDCPCGCQPGQDRLEVEGIDGVKDRASIVGLWRMEAKSLPPRHISVGVRFSKTCFLHTWIDNDSSTRSQ